MRFKLWSNMEAVTIKSLEQYLALFHSFEETEVYRGVGNVDEFKLVPTAGRFGISDTKTQIEFERQLLTDFKRSAPLYSSLRPTNELEWLFLAQHHGLPTRLLDWTFNPLVALFFAIENPIEQNGAVYCCFPSKLIDHEAVNSWNDPFNIDCLMAIVPSRDHIRYGNQNGLFTIQPDPNLEDLTEITKKIVIPGGSKSSISWKLRKIGISKAFLFSDLDSLAYDILKMNKNKYRPYFNEKKA